MGEDLLSDAAQALGMLQYTGKRRWISWSKNEKDLATVTARSPRYADNLEMFWSPSW
jgi:hypothetical protein